jgi:hypothetical protein
VIFLNRRKGWKIGTTWACETAWPIAALSATFALSTWALTHTAQRLLPTADGHVGHDYNYFSPYLLTGAAWIKKNGWFAIPHFTPDFCGGIPLLAHPLSIFYSLPQLLTVVLADPIAAAKWTLLIYATIGGATTCILLRRCFDLSWHAAALGFVLFQLNGFLLFRVSIGHVPYHIYGLVPSLCLCCLFSSKSGVSTYLSVKLGSDIVSCAVGGVILALMVYGGAPNYIVPAVLSVTVIILLHQTRAGFLWRPWVVLVISCLWAIPLSALKLIPSYIFVSSYPRPYLSQYLFHSPIDLAKSLFSALFVPEAQPFGISIVPAALILADLVTAYRRRRTNHHLFAWIGLVFVAAVPILGTLGNTTWGQILIQIPILNNNTVLTRWWSVYILMFIVWAAVSFDKLVPPGWVRHVTFGVLVTIAVGQLAFRDLTFYTTTAAFPLYDPWPVTLALRNLLNNGVALPQTTRVGFSPNAEIVGKGINDGLLAGISAFPCYEPIFGYSHEWFPARSLKIGPIHEPEMTVFNLADPRCYLSWRASECRPGDQFRLEDAADVAEFTSHYPLRWQQPRWQILARVMTIVGLCSTVMVLVCFSLYHLYQVSLVSKSRGWFRELER